MVSAVVSVEDVAATAVIDVRGVLIGDVSAGERACMCCEVR